MSRATNDMSAVRMVLGPGIMYTASTLATFVATVAMMLAISPRLTLMTLVPLLLVSWLVRHYGRQVHDRYEEVQAQLAEMNALVQENLSGARVVRAYAQEPAEERRFAEANRDYVARNRRLVRIAGILHPGIGFLMGLGSLTVLWLGGRMVVAREVTLGEFVAFGVYLAMLHWPMIALGWVVNLVERGEASLGRIHAILDAVPEIRDEAPLPVTTLAGEVEFRGLDFAYGDEPVLAGHLAQGPRRGHGGDRRADRLRQEHARVALAAAPGPARGPRVRGRPRRAPAAARDAARGRRLRPAGELPVLGHAARERRARRTAPPSAPSAAARIAQLEKDVAGFAQGFDTRVGERGVTLSGGQRQRTALARALATDPRILVLDDALSAVDTETEEEILSGLRGFMRQRTTFLVSHRVSTVKDADLIVVMREGRIVERGRHDELVALGGFYAELHRRQLLEREIETGEDAA